MATYQAYRFFKEHAGGVGRIDQNGRVAMEHARVALDLARAEELLERACNLSVACVQWLDDETPYDPGDFVTEDEAREKFASNEWTGPYGCRVLVYQQGDTTPSDEASLWGIVVGPRGTADPYCRVVAAELASELEDELRQTIGDALDIIEEKGISYV